MLHRSEYTVITAAHGVAAREYVAAAAPPHAILVELEMPVMDGLCVANRLGAGPLWRSIPVELMSGNPAAQSLAHDLTTAKFLAKSFNQQTRLMTVRAIPVTYERRPLYTQP